MSKKSITRIVASLIDFLICSVIAIICFIPAIAAKINLNFSDNPSNIDALAICCFVSGCLLTLAVIAYLIIVPTIFKGQSIGKRIFKLKMICIDGSKLEFSKLFSREFVRLVLLVTTLGLSAFVNVFLILFSRKHRSIQDSIFGITVVDIIS